MNNETLLNLYSERSTKLTMKSVLPPNPVKGSERLRPLIGKKVQLLDNAPYPKGTIVKVLDSWKDNGYSYYLVQYKKGTFIVPSRHLGKIIK